MYDNTVIQQLSEFVDENEQVMKRWMDELLAYLKSGLNYMTFINTAQYEYIDGDDDDNNNEEKEEEEEEEEEETTATMDDDDGDDYDEYDDDLSPSTSFISASSTISSSHL